uniref:Uncharacterized protein n=1 Tax=Leersia perrieri TaxID=77586 RepID=A0A0D9V7T1_9ORYZ
MERKNLFPQPEEPHVEGKKSSAPTSMDDVTNTKDYDSPLRDLLYPPYLEEAKSKDDIYSIFYKGQNGPAQAGTADGKPQWTPPKSRIVYTKDGKQSIQYDSVDTSCFGSSVNYGGRDYYGTPGPKQSTESNDYKVDKKDPSTDSHGDWFILLLSKLGGLSLVDKELEGEELELELELVCFAVAMLAVSVT